MNKDKLENIQIQCSQYMYVGIINGAEKLRGQIFFYVDEFDGKVYLIASDGFRLYVSHTQLVNHFKYVGSGICTVRCDKSSWYYQRILSKCEVK